MKIDDYYNNYDEENRLLSRYGMVEFLTTMNYIEKYITPDSRILEIGAGTGRYSHTLAKKGYYVDAVELVEHNIEIFKEKITPDENITIRQVNATDLSDFKDNQYDITLLLGPMYHLFTEQEQIKALSEAFRVTKQGGLIFSAYCMGDATILTYGFMRNKIKEIMIDCRLDDSFSKFISPWGIFQLYRTEDIISLRNKLKAKSLHLVGTDGYSNHMREKLENMDEETFKLYLKYHLATCERNDMLGISHHTLDIFRKE
ncbi:MAG: class I SAM-dependent methyltransferase [Ruminococcus sp.]